MYERGDAGRGDTDSEPAVIQIDATVFETLSPPSSSDAPRIVRWLGAWAGRP